jgi:uncharacterized membrane protein
MHEESPMAWTGVRRADRSHLRWTSGIDRQDHYGGYGGYHYGGYGGYRGYGYGGAGYHYGVGDYGGYYGGGSATATPGIGINPCTSASAPASLPPGAARSRTGLVAPGKRRTMMATSLVVLKYDTPDGAEKGLELAYSLQKKMLLELLDAATVTWPAGKKRPTTRHAGDMTCAGACDGAFWGFLFGLIFFVPFFGAVVGAAMGALMGHFADYGIGRDFIEQVRGKVTEGTSALFLLVGQVTADRVVEAFKAGPKCEVIASNLSVEQEERLKAAFAR